MATLFPPDSLLGRYEDLLAERNALLLKVKDLQARLRRFEEGSSRRRIQGSSVSEVSEEMAPADGLENSKALCSRANGKKNETLAGTVTGGTDESSKSGWSCKTCVSTSTTVCEGEGCVSQDFTPSQETPTHEDQAGKVAGESNTTLSSGTFVIGRGTSGVRRSGDSTRVCHRLRRTPLHVKLPRDEGDKFGAEGRRSLPSPGHRYISSPSASPEASFRRGIVGSDDFVCTEDVPSRLSSMSAGQISKICTTPEVGFEAFMTTDGSFGRSGRSAGVCNGWKDGKKKCSGAIADGFGDHYGSYRSPNRFGYCTEFGKSASVSPRLSLTELCEQMMKGIDDMKQVSLDVCRRTGITTEGSIDIERASTMPLTSSHSVLMTSTTERTDREMRTSSQALSNLATETLTPSSAQEKQSMLRSQELWSTPSNIPPPPKSPSALNQETHSLKIPGSSLFKKPDQGNASDVVSRENSATSTTCMSTECGATSQSPTHSFVESGLTPEPMEYSQMMESSLSGSKGERKQMYENPLSSCAMDTLCTSPCVLQAPQILPMESGDTNGIGAMKMRGCATQSVAGRDEGNPSCSISKPKRNYPIVVQERPEEDCEEATKGVSLQTFRALCDVIHEGTDKVQMDDNSIGAVHGSVAGALQETNGPVVPEHLQDMVETVRKKFESEGPPRKLLSPVSEESSVLSLMCDARKEPPRGELGISKQMLLRKCTPFQDKLPVSRSRLERSVSDSGLSRRSSGKSSLGKIEFTSELSREKTLQHVELESSVSKMKRCFSSLCLGNRVTMSRRARIAASQTLGAVTDFVVSQAIVSKGRVQFDIHCDRLDGWAFVGIVSSEEVKSRRSRGLALAECSSSFGWTNDSEFFSQGTYHFEALREMISTGANFQINIDCDRGVVSFRLAHPTRNGGHSCHKRYLVCELENLPQHDWQLAIEWLGTARFELLDIKRWP